MTQTTSFTSAPKSAMIDGVATVTIVVSTRIMKKPRHSANNAGQGRTPSGTSVVGRPTGDVVAMSAVNTRGPRTIPPLPRRPSLAA